MSHLLAQKGDEIKGAKQAAEAGAAKGQQVGAAGATGERNTVKGNLNMAVEIINNCFNLDAPKSVQKIGLFKLQCLLPDYKLLYPLYVDVLIQTDDEIKQIILSDQPIKEGEEIFYGFGNGSFNYKLKSDLKNFDNMLMANSLIDLIIQYGYDSLSKE
jgi:hypothetical protein